MITRYRNIHKFLLISPVLLALLLQANQAFAQGHYSARIYSLGGSAVSGIIPDYFMDLVINPAYAAIADELTVNYGYRSSPSQVLPFPYLNSYFKLQRSSTSGLSTSELTAYGIRISSWRFALAAEWRFDRFDETDSSFERTTNRWSDGFINDYSNNQYINDSDYWRIDLSAAHSIGGEHAVGVRFGGSEYYHSYYRRRSTLTESYSHSEYLDEIILRDEYSRDNLDSRLFRWPSVYLQIGLLLGKSRKEPSEIVFSISRDPISSHYDNYYMSASQYYDQYSEIEKYIYHFDEWRDNRKGDLWTFNLSGRHTLPSGVRLFLGGGFETSSYELDWSTIAKDYKWDPSTTYNINSNALYGDGDCKDISFFTKVGKTFSIHNKLDITIGARAIIERYWSDENPRATSIITHETYLAHDSISCAQKLRFESTTTKLGFLCPIALEYRPSGYFSCFAGFAADINWKSKTDEYTIPDPYSDILSSNTLFNRLTKIYGDPSNQSYKMSKAKNTRDELDTRRLATFGFSTRYKDRLFLYIYTGSDLTPDSVTNTVLDIRYVF